MEHILHHEPIIYATKEAADKKVQEIYDAHKVEPFPFDWCTEDEFHDEFSIYTTTEEIFGFIDELLESGFSNELEIYDKCIERFGDYFTQHLDSLNE